MKLFFVDDHSSWGWTKSVVRAETAEQAAALARAPYPHLRVDVSELAAPEGAAVLWTEDYSPDTPRDYD